MEKSSMDYESWKQKFKERLNEYNVELCNYEELLKNISIKNLENIMMKLKDCKNLVVNSLEGILYIPELGLLHRDTDLLFNSIRDPIKQIIKNCDAKNKLKSISDAIYKYMTMKGNSTARLLLSNFLSYVHKHMNLNKQIENNNNWIDARYNCLSENDKSLLKFNSDLKNYGSLLAENKKIKKLTTNLLSFLENIKGNFKIDEDLSDFIKNDRTLVKFLVVLYQFNLNPEKLYPKNLNPEELHHKIKKKNTPPNYKKKITTLPTQLKKQEKMQIENVINSILEEPDLNYLERKTKEIMKPLLDKKKEPLTKSEVNNEYQRLLNSRLTPLINLLKLEQILLDDLRFQFILRKCIKSRLEEIYFKFKQLKDLKQKDLKQKDLKQKDLKQKDLKQKDLKQKDLKTKDLKTKDLKTKDLKTKDLKTKRFKTKDLKTKDLKQKDLKQKKLVNSNFFSETTPTDLTFQNEINAARKFAKSYEAELRYLIKKEKIKERVNTKVNKGVNVLARVFHNNIRNKKLDVMYRMKVNKWLLSSTTFDNLSVLSESFDNEQILPDDCLKYLDTNWKQLKEKYTKKDKNLEHYISQYTDKIKKISFEQEKKQECLKKQAKEKLNEMLVWP